MTIPNYKIRGLKRVSKSDGCVTWYWAPSQVSRKSAEFRPRTVRLWHGCGEPSEKQLVEIQQQAEHLNMDLQEWLDNRRNATRIKRPKRGTVYFIRAGERVKIGFTQSIATRLSQLQTFYPEALEVLLTMPGSVLMEKELHRRFEGFCVGREWFLYSKPIADFVAKMSAGPAG